MIALFALLSCRSEHVFVPIDPGWNRMQVQGKQEPYGFNPLFPGGQGMRPVPADTETWTPTGTGDRPPTRDLALVRRGQHRYGVTCEPCHGTLGDAMTAVAKRMSLRRPPSLHDPRIRALTDAEIHDIVVHGYGLMPAYGARMSATDTWAVVGYVRALQLSQNANLDQLPERVRAQGLQALP